MINLDIILSQLEAALKDVDKTSADQLSEEARINIAEMLVNLQMQLDMLGEAAHVQFGPRLKVLMAAAADADIDWQLKNR